MNSKMLNQDRVFTPTTPHKIHGTPPADAAAVKAIQEASLGFEPVPNGEISPTAAILAMANEIKKVAANGRREPFSVWLGAANDWAIREKVELRCITIGAFPSGITGVTFSLQQDSGAGAQAIPFNFSNGTQTLNTRIPFKNGIWIAQNTVTGGTAAVPILLTGYLL